MGFGKNSSGFSRKEAKALGNNKKPGKSARELQKERDQRRAAEQAAARQKAAKTVTGNPSHYTSGNKRSGGTTRSERHHGDD